MPDEKDIILSKKVMPASLKSDAIREKWSKTVKENAIFSANTTSKNYLEYLKQILAQFAVGGKSPGESRTALTEKLSDMGLLEKQADSGSAIDRMKRLGSKMRLDLVLKTNKQIAHSTAMQIAGEDPLQKMMYPAYELVRDEYRRTHRDWKKRWDIAASSVNYEGVAKNSTKMIALKNSPIWKALGSLFKDGLDNAMPPFAFGSGMGWEIVDRDECIKLGLIEDDQA